MDAFGLKQFEEWRKLVGYDSDTAVMAYNALKTVENIKIARSTANSDSEFTRLVQEGLDKEYE